MEAVIGGGEPKMDGKKEGRKTGFIGEVEGCGPSIEDLEAGGPVGGSHDEKGKEHITFVSVVQEEDTTV